MEEKLPEPGLPSTALETVADSTISQKKFDESKSLEKNRTDNNEIPKNQYIQEAIKGASSLSYSVNEFKKRLHKYLPSDRFTWPDHRTETENAIIQLKEKQILLVKGISSDWFNWAPQRIASVLQASRNKLWPGCDGVYRVKDEDKLSFSFWKTFEEFDKPTIIVIPANSAIEYLKNFILADYDKVSYDFKETLRSVHVFLIVLVQDNDETAGILKKDEAQGLLKEIYATWTIPVIKLELQRKRGKEGEQLYRKIIHDNKLTGRNARIIYNIINEEDISNDENVLNTIKQEIQIESAASELIENACKEETELKLRLIYCGAFFNELTPADFTKIATYLLNSQSEEIVSSDGKSTVNKPLNDIWRKPTQLDRILAESMLITKHTGKIRRIGFTRHVSSEQIKCFFLEKKHIIFLTFTEELIKQNILFNNDISNELKEAIIKLFSVVIADNYDAYDDNWLFRTALDQAALLYASIHDEQTFELIELSERISDISILRNTFTPLKGILKELLLSGQEHLTLIVKRFFKRLMDSRLKKNVAIGLAIDLYKELQETGNFPEEELDKYFKQALNVKDFEEKFYAYRMMVKNLYYKDLYKKTSDWLMDDSDDEPWTKKFSWLYKLDFCILTFHIHFQINKGDNEYELFAVNSESPFNEDFKQLLRDITSEKCIKSWLELLQHEDLFKYKFMLLEKTVTDISKLEGREDDQNRTPLSLAGDVLENWFYILFLNENKLNDVLKTDLLKEYTVLLNEVIDKKKLMELEGYWRRKAKKIYSDTINKYKREASMEEKERDDKVQKLKTRRDSVDLLVELL